MKIDNFTVEPVLTPGWKGTEYLDSYAQTLKALGALDRLESVDIGMPRFRDGPLTLFGFDLSPDRSDASPCKRGVTSLEMRFAQPTPTVGLTGIVYAYFHGMMTIDGARNVCVYDRIYKEM